MTGIVSADPSCQPSPFDAIRRTRDDGTEYWLGRELQAVVEYSRWEDFAKLIERARVSAANTGADVDRAFSVITEKGAGRPRTDVELSRFAAYLTVMNGDPNMPRIAEGQAYFAIRTREAETAKPPRLSDAELMAYALQASQRTIEARDARIEQQAAQLTAQAPKVSYVDTYVSDTDLLSFSTVASTHDITEKALRELLIERDWIYVQEESRWSNSKERKEIRRRYSEYATHKRHFRRVEVHEAPRFRGEVMHTLKVTPAGAEAIGRLISKAA